MARDKGEDCVILIAGAVLTCVGLIGTTLPEEQLKVPIWTPWVLLVLGIALLITDRFFNRYGK